VADAARDNSVHVCARSRAGSSSSCAAWAWPRRGCRHSLAQWPSLPQLWQVSSRAGFWLLAVPPWAPSRALPSAHPRAPSWVPPRALRSLPRLWPSVEGDDSPFFPSCW
jgi:hypothetical protein